MTLLFFALISQWVYNFDKKIMIWKCPFVRTTQKRKETIFAKELFSGGCKCLCASVPASPWVRLWRQECVGHWVRYLKISIRIAIIIVIFYWKDFLNLIWWQNRWGTTTEDGVQSEILQGFVRLSCAMHYYIQYRFTKLTNALVRII